MLLGERRGKRGILNLDAKALKFLFGAALSEDLGPINRKIKTLRDKVVEIVHDATEHVTVSHEMDFRFRANAKRLVQIVQAMKLHNEEMVRDQLTLDQKINQTRDQGSNAMRKASYTRELEVLIMKIYTDVSL
jgi:hypothetical protein